MKTFRIRSISSLLGLLVLCAANLFPQAADWALTNWKVRVAISNLSPVGLASGDALTNFPVLISLSNDDAVRSAARGNGGDLTFTGLNGSQLFHEIESFDRATGLLLAWVCVPTFTNGTQIWLYASNASTSLVFVGSNFDESLSVTSTNFRTQTNLWQRTWESNYYVVYHFTNATGAKPNDSTRWTNHVTAIAGTPSVYSGLSNGVVGPGWYSDFSTNAGANYLQISTNAFSRDPQYLTNRPSTMSMWYRATDFPSNHHPNAQTNPGGVVGYSNNATSLFQWVGNGTLGADSKAYLNWSHDGTTKLNAASTGRGAFSKGNTFLPNEWTFYSVAGGVEGGVKQASRIIQNAVTLSLDGGSAPSSGTFSVDLKLMGAANSQYPSCRFNPVGWFDEFRLSTVIRSSNWSLTEYSNAVAASNGGTFRVGALELGDLTPPTLSSVPAGDLVSNLDFGAQLSIGDGTGFWSTNGGVTWTSFTAAGTTVGISNTCTLLFYAVDDWSNVSATNIRSWTVGADPNPPVISNSHSNALTTNASFAVFLSVDENWAYWTTNAWLVTNQLAKGTNMITVSGNTTLAWYGKDLFGNVRPTNTVVYTFDSVLPVITRTASATNASAIAVSASVDKGTLWWTTNGWTQTNAVVAGVPVNFTASNANLQFLTFAFDSAGNRTAIHTNAYLSDLLAAVISVSPASLTSNAPGRFVWTTSETNAFWSTNGGATWNVVSSLLPQTNWISNGQGALLVYGVDALGNRSATNSNAFLVNTNLDVVPPVLTYEGPSSGCATNRDFTVTFFVTRPTGWLSEDSGATWTAFSSSRLFAVTNGVTSLLVYTATSNDYRSATNRWVFTNDQIAPVVSGLPASFQTNATFKVSLAVSKPTGYWSTNNTVSSTSFSQSTELTVNRDVILFTWAVDASGNASPTNFSSFRVVPDASRIGDASNSLSGLVNGRVVSGALRFGFSAVKAPVVEIYGIAGNLVRRFAAGDASVDVAGRLVSWDGLTERGLRAPVGTYVVVLKVDDKVVDSKRVVLRP